MEEYILLIILSIMTVALTVIYGFGLILKKENILTYRYSILTVLLHSLFLIGTNFASSEIQNIALHNTIPVLNLFLFRNLYVEFSKQINKKDTSALKYVFVRAVPFIFIFIMSLSTIQLVANKQLEIDVVDAFDFAVVISVVIYQFAILTNLFILNIKLKRATLEKYQHVFLINILIITVYASVLFMNLILGTLTDNFMTSGIVYLVLVGFTFTNYIKKDYLYEVKVYKKMSARSEDVSNQTNKTIALDALTGVFAREYFIRHIKTFDKEEESLSVVIMQITGLKLINESFGYERGDEILQEVILVVSDIFAESTIARLSGSQFAIIQTSLSDNEIADKIKIIESICKERDGFIVNIYFGVYMRRKSDLLLFDIYKRAEQDLYYNKLISNKRDQSKLADALWKNFGELLPSLYMHLKRCSNLAEEFALHMNMNATQVNDLRNAALLHDIALTFMPTIVEYEVSFKDAFEEKVYMSHTSKGYDIAVESGISPNAAEAILYHHENFDGSGYPHGSRGDEIPYLAQIVALVDLIDMMMHYGKKTEALENVLLSKIGIEFSSELVYTMIDFLKKRKFIKEIS
ncbi:MAG: diguanylate cyclase [Clostridiales bacterium]|nr:diguanylate cyclase [Clostridiales bacterium]